MSRDGDELTDLVVRARAGDVTAFEALYRGHQTGIYTFIRSQVREPELAADLTQQTFVRAWQSLPRLRAVGAFRGWLHRIAMNLVRDELKSGRARLEVPASVLPDDQLGASALVAGPDEQVVSRELRGAVWSALAELPPDQCIAVVMHHIEGMSVSEIAQAAGVRPGTVMSRLARGRAALRKRLSPYVEASDERVRSD
jgi:RNA polymerase sigma-70 factor (ECF subfamily)